MSSIQACGNYFNGFSEVFSSKTSCCTKTIGAVKIASYATIVIPLVVGMASCCSSACSLEDRVAVEKKNVKTGLLSSRSREILKNLVGGDDQGLSPGENFTYSIFEKE